MVVKTEKRMVEVFDTTYVAVDGTEFKSEGSCLEYEKQLATDELIAKADKLRLVDLDDTYPLDTDGQYVSDCKSFTWYQVCDEEDYNTINALFNNEIAKPTSYPEIICVETEGECYCDVYDYRLSDMEKSTIAFWKNFGYEVEFKGVKEL